MLMVPTHLERQFMQRLRGRGWVEGVELPPSPRIVDALLRKGWIEALGDGRDLAFRITKEGMAAKTALIPLKKRIEIGNRDREVVQPDQGRRSMKSDDICPAAADSGGSLSEVKRANHGAVHP